MAAGIIVRTATPSDEAAVADVLKASYPMLMAGAYPPDLLAEALKVMTRPHPRLLRSGRYYLAEADGEAVGCGGWSKEVPGSDRVVPGAAHLRHFAVAACWAGRGVGRSLYDACAAAARAEGARRLHVYASLNAEPFYAAMGFRRVGPIRIPLPGTDGFPSLHMRREL